METDTIRQILYAVQPMTLENLESEVKELWKNNYSVEARVEEQEYVFVVSWSDREVMDGYYSIVVKK